MPGVEPVACATLTLHTCAGVLAVTPASVGHRDQQPPHRAAATGGRRAAYNSRYSSDEERTGTLVPDIGEHGPNTELVARILGFSSDNARSNPWRVGGVDYTSDACTVQRMLKVMRDTHSSLHLIQEHKLGKHTYAYDPAFDGELNDHWGWLAWPGKSIRQQGWQHSYPWSMWLNTSSG